MKTHLEDSMLRKDNPITGHRSEKDSCCKSISHARKRSISHSRRVGVCFLTYLIVNAVLTLAPSILLLLFAFLFTTGKIERERNSLSKVMCSPGDLDLWLLAGKV